MHPESCKHTVPVLRKKAKQKQRQEKKKKIGISFQEITCIITRRGQIMFLFYIPFAPVDSEIKTGLLY